MARAKIKVGISTDRGRARRTAILDAAIDVVARDGTGAVTHRAVARLARVPLASTTYYFASRDDLLLEAFRHLTARRMAAYDAAAAVLPARLSAEVDRMTDATPEGLARLWKDRLKDARAFSVCWRKCRWIMSASSWAWR